MAPVRTSPRPTTRRTIGSVLAAIALLTSGPAECRGAGIETGAHASKSTQSRRGAEPRPPALQPGSIQRGRISWYGRRADSKSTASGETLDPDALTMAHPTLPFGSMVRVTNLRNHRSVVVRVNDRGPGVAGRLADVSRAAARKLGMIGTGVVRARLEVLSLGEEDGEDGSGGDEDAPHGTGDAAARAG